VVKLDEVKLSLEARLDRLTGRLSRIDSELRSPGPADAPDRATESENREVLEKLSESERQEVQDIRQALGRIRTGTYTVCSGCGHEISAGRLEALPYTSLCVKCAA
jgi:DnaK suppressor protein